MVSYKTGQAEEGHRKRLTGSQETVKISYDLFVYKLKKMDQMRATSSSVRWLNDGSPRETTQDFVLNLILTFLSVTWIKIKICAYKIFGSQKADRNN